MIVMVSHGACTQVLQMQDLKQAAVHLLDKGVSNDKEFVTLPRQYL